MSQKLIRCKTCGAQIAKSAKHCPNCGAKQHQVLLTLSVILIVIFVFVWVVALFGDDNEQPHGSDGNSTASASSNNNTQNNNNKTNDIEVIAVSSQDLYTAYEENKVNADNLYKGKILAVTGEITDITQDLITKNPCIKLDTGDTYGIYTIQCFFKDNDDTNAYIAELRDGQTVTIYGKCTGVPVLEVQLSNCYFE